MTLYAANLMDLAKPVENKKKKAPKEKAEKSAPVEKSAEDEKNEKRAAALLKAQEARKRKREERENAKKAEQQEIAAKQEEIKAKEEEILRKKEEAKEKRRLKKEEKQKLQEQTPTATDESVSVTESEPKPKKVRKQKAPRDESVPPPWFQKYVEGVKQEEAKHSQVKVSKKQVEQEARTAAAEQWSDGLTRDRVQNEVDGHMSRMYGMIFHNRRMK